MAIQRQHTTGYSSDAMGHIKTHICILEKWCIVMNVFVWAFVAASFIIWYTEDYHQKKERK